MNLNEVIRDAYEEKYLIELAKKFALMPEKNYVAARSIIMDVHLSLEYMMNFGIAQACYMGRKKIRRSICGISPSEVFEAISEIHFFDKIRIVDKLYIVSSGSIGILRKINKIRNAFAHGYDVSSPKYRYNGKPIFLKGTINDVIIDRKKVLADFSKSLSAGTK
jgi:hypothetical protein